MTMYRMINVIKK